MTTTADRLEVRISAQDKQTIARAAELRGEGVSAFARSVLVREAERVLEAEKTVVLSAKESRRFLQALDRPFSPNAKLRAALARGDKLGL